MPVLYTVGMTKTWNFITTTTSGDVVSALDQSGGVWTAIGDLAGDPLVITPTGGHVRRSEAVYEGTHAFMAHLTR